MGSRSNTHGLYAGQCTLGFVVHAGLCTRRKSKVYLRWCSALDGDGVEDVVDNLLNSGV